MSRIVIRDLERNEVLDTAEMDKVRGGLWAGRMRKLKTNKLQFIRPSSSLVSATPIEIP